MSGLHVFFPLRIWWFRLTPSPPFITNSEQSCSWYFKIRYLITVITNTVPISKYSPMRWRCLSDGQISRSLAHQWCDTEDQAEIQVFNTIYTVHVMQYYWFFKLIYLFHPIRIIFGLCTILFISLMCLVFFF